VATDSGELSAPVTARDHVRGPLDAAIQLVEYGDYECPHCGRAYWVIRQLQEKLGNRLAFVFRNFPLTEVHPRADSVARALEAAGAQGYFWEMHDRFYEHQHELEGLDLTGHAERVGLDIAQWKRDMKDARFRDRVREDVATGLSSGVTGTPTFFINGTRYEGPHDFDSMVMAIESALR
jgi:formate-nitrite transporter family protein